MEEFKKIFVDYEIGTCGTVRSLKWNKVKILSPQLDKQGYLCIVLMIDGKKKRYLVHRLVALTFIPNPENKPCVNHINGIKSDNHVENLEWVTYSENVQHAYDTGLAHQGEEHGHAKLANEQVACIRDNPDNLKGVELARQFDVSETTIRYIQLGKIYKSVGGNIRQSKSLPRVPDNIRDEIRQLYAQGGISQSALAKQFGISQPAIWNIIHEE